MTTDYGRHEARALTLLAQFAEHVQWAKPNDREEVARATAHIGLQGVEELQLLRQTIQDSADEIVGALTDVAEAINGLAAVTETRRTWRQRRARRRVHIEPLPAQPATEEPQ